MKKGLLPFLLLFLCFLAPFSAGVTDTYTTLNCAFSSPIRTISAKATFYSGNVPTCSPMTLVATLPNSTKFTYSAKSCSGGVHDFSFDAPVNGVYQLNASVAGTTASCSSAALFFEQRPRVSEVNPLLAILVGLAAVAIARRTKE